MFDLEPLFAAFIKWIMTSLDKGCWLGDVSGQMPYLYFDQGVASIIKLSDDQLHSAYNPNLRYIGLVFVFFCLNEKRGKFVGVV